MASNRRGGASSMADPESLERENDNSMDELSTRVGMLKDITRGIRDEVRSQNTLLDGMGSSMDGSSTLLVGSVGRFKKVFSDKANRRTFSIVAGLVAAFLLLYLLLRHR